VAYERGIEPHVKLIDKAERTDGTFSRSDFAFDPVPSRTSTRTHTEITQGMEGAESTEFARCDGAATPPCFRRRTDPRDPLSRAHARVMTLRNGGHRPPTLGTLRKENQDRGKANRTVVERYGQPLK
jgi:hypothetical protein